MKQQLLNKFVIKMQGKIESEKIVSLFTTELNNDMDHSSNTPFITGFEPRLREFLNDKCFLQNKDIYIVPSMALFGRNLIQADIFQGWKLDSS